MILLTGATGSAGSFIANEFVREREPVRILVRDRAKAAGLEKIPTVEIVEGDMSRRSSLGPALEGVDRVLVISAPRMDMVETQSAFIDACKAAGVRHVIKFSGLDARRDTAFRSVSCTRTSRNISRTAACVDPSPPDRLHAGISARCAEHHQRGRILLGARRREAQSDRPRRCRQDRLSAPARRRT